MTESSVEPGSFRPFEVTAVHLIYVGLGFFIVLFGMFSLFIKERLYLGEAPLAAVFGIIVGPACLNLFNPSHWANNESGPPGGHITDEVTLEVLRVTIALSVFAVGVELPKKYLLRHWKSIAFLLGPVMVWGWIVTAAFMYALIPGLDFLNSLVVASCVTPTDPILAQAVVGGPWAEKHVPAHLRHILMCESGCNDGAAFPFLYLALFLTLNRHNRGKAIAEWFYDAWAYQIIFGTLLGALIGWAARKLMRFSERHKLVDRESFVAQYVSLAIASMGVNVLLGSDDLLAAFACGTAFAWDGWFTRQTEDSNFSSIVDLLFNVAVFIYIGSLMPFRDWVGGPPDEPNTLSLWRLFVLAICVLLTKRIPIVLALWRWIPDIKTFREAVFAGHFGPIGVGAIFIATLARTELPETVPSPPRDSNDILALTVQPVIYFFVICSIALHGLTIPFFAFSKGASRMTRTWSRNPSFAKDGEPNWVSRMRSKRTGDSLHAEEGNMTEIERVLNAQLRQIGRGAIGGDAEKELSRSVTQNGSGSSESEDAVLKAGNIQRLRRNETDEEHRDGDEFESPTHWDPQGDDWGGENTIEMRRYLEKERAKKENEYAALRMKQQNLDEKERVSRESDQRDHAEGDIGAQSMLDEERGPMDRDIPRSDSEKGKEEAERRKATEDEAEQDRLNDKGKSLWGTQAGSSSSSTSSARQEREHAKIREACEEHYPKSRSWVEGDKLVIEYQKSRLSEVECHTMPLFDHERDSIGSSETPAHAWAMEHADALQHYGGLEGVREWSPRDAINNLLHHGIPSKYTDAIHHRRKRRPSDTETKEQQNARFQALYGGMQYASERRNELGEGHSGQAGTMQAGSAGDTFDSTARSSRSKSKKEGKPARVRTPSPEVVGWLAPRPARPSAPTRRPTNRRGGSYQRRNEVSSSPTRSNSPPSLRPGSSIRFAPREHKLASESRRRKTTQKVLSGQMGLRPLPSLGSRIKEEVIEHPSDPVRRTGIGFERSASLGGLGSDDVSTSSASTTTQHSNNPIRMLFGRHHENKLGIAKTASFGSAGGGSVRHPVPQRTSTRSSSVQWVDDNENAPSTNDYSRIGGGISRPASRTESPVQTRTSTLDDSIGYGRDASGSNAGSSLPRTDSLGDESGRRHGRSNRLSSLLSSITPHAIQVPRPHHHHHGRHDRQQSIPEHTPPPTVLLGAGAVSDANGGGGILADSGSIRSSSTAVPPPQQQQDDASKENRPTNQDDSNSSRGQPPERGVTFDV